MRPLLDCIFVTYNNGNLLTQALNSVYLSIFGPAKNLLRIIIVNNGHRESLQWLKESGNLKIVHAPENRGWEGGLKLGLQVSDAPFVAFCNDDIRFPTGQKEWFWKMLSSFNDPKVAAVGPCSNFVCGPQTLFADIEDKYLDVKYLIGFFVIVRRKALEEAGGVDDALPGGDDIDLSIRFRDLGYRLMCRRDVFVFHHGQISGKRIHGDYWDSEEHHDRTYESLIRKHGMKKFWETWIIGWQNYKPYTQWGWGSEDVEGRICSEHVLGDKILELGCGGRKTVENSVGVDLIPFGQEVPGVTSGEDRCIADLTGDVSLGLPVETESQDTVIARHILEHCQDPLGTLALWNKAIKVGGRLIIAVPNQQLGNTIIQNPEHVMTFVPSSLNNMAQLCGFKQLGLHTDVNGVSFISVFEKTGEPEAGIVDPEATVPPQASRLETVSA